jgi:hypothetical protein
MRLKYNRPVDFLMNCNFISLLAGTKQCRSVSSDFDDDNRISFNHNKSEL